jgi:hypothetical protein
MSSISQKVYVVSSILLPKFAREPVPDARLHLVRTQATLETPLGNFIVCAALPNALTHCRKLDAKEAAQMAIQTNTQTEIGVILRWQLSGLVQPNLVEHPCEMTQAADFLIGAAQTFDFHVGVRFRLSFKG